MLTKNINFVKGNMVKTRKVPPYTDLMKPTMQALRDLGDSGSIQEIAETVIENLHLHDDIVAIPHNEGKSNQTEVEYRLAWARTYLKKAGYIDNSQKGIWFVLSDYKNIDLNSIDGKEISRAVRSKQPTKKQSQSSKSEDVSPEDKDTEIWRDELHRILIEEIKPDAFERLTMRMLREAGFIELEVTGRSGDGGIDGKGIMRIGGMLSFHVLFQCKKYKGSVSPSAIRDFRGALDGRADKGLFVTTGTFTRDARKEATRDGATPIDLIDGDELANKLKELSLGIKTEIITIETVNIDEEWFQKL